MFFSQRKKEEKKPEPKDFSRHEFKKKLKSSWKGNKMSSIERMNLEKNLFPRKKYGSDISEKDINKVIKRLKAEDHKTRDWDKKKKIRIQEKIIKDTLKP